MVAIAKELVGRCLSSFFEVPRLAVGWLGVREEVLYVSTLRDRSYAPILMEEGLQ